MNSECIPVVGNVMKNARAEGEIEAVLGEAVFHVGEGGEADREPSDGCR
jgi:hypothetical protein